MSGVLVVAAHPDDEVLGCGGTMAKATAAGVPVHVAILGEGATSRAPDRASGDADEVAALVESAEAAQKTGDFPACFAWAKMGLQSEPYASPSEPDVLHL